VEIIKDAPGAALDAGLIAVVQAVECCEIARFGTLCERSNTGFVGASFQFKDQGDQDARVSDGHHVGTGLGDDLLRGRACGSGAVHYADRQGDVGYGISLKDQSRKRAFVAPSPSRVEDCKANGFRSGAFVPIGTRGRCSPFGQPQVVLVRHGKCGGAALV